MRAQLAACLAASTLLMAWAIGAAAGLPAAASAAAGGDGSGKALYEKACTPCHGAHGQGDDGPPLAGTPLPAKQIALTVSVGVPGEMPSFKKRFSAGQIDQIAAYVKSLPPLGK